MDQLPPVPRPVPPEKKRATIPIIHAVVRQVVSLGIFAALGLAGGLFVAKQVKGNSKQRQALSDLMNCSVRVAHSE